MLIPHCDPLITRSWQGHISLEQTADYTRPWRLPVADRELYYPDLVDRAKTQAGIRLSFYSNTSRIAGRILPFEDNQPVDLYLDGVFHSNIPLAGQSQFAFENLHGGEHLVELWLPQRGDFALQYLELSDNASFTPYIDSRPRWVTYGSSITHCRNASSPSFTWPGIVARHQEWNHTNLGFGGHCHLDPLLACVIRDLPASYISICAGINIYGMASLNHRTFATSLIGFVRIIREKHPVTPILLISPIFSCHRETTPNAVGWTLQDYRNAVEEAVQRLRAHGDSHIHYLNGLELFDESLAHLLPDQLHPDAEGIRIMGQRFIEKGVPLLLEIK